ncbi:RdgB/HAM1 family non-canonical purine NTP pyrophosphatase [Patescibacteria group bacterium]|nr:RdgB/HAM1 family non-canonical purine NTP pyrophosphatase [Patescibacteria group bacterium]MBU2543816.1 RdgB/HAM1 family non-canonical purine NTP pyrophosphatase [Patescibacteria group bacterium]
MKLLFATTNQGKVEEAVQLLSECSVELLLLNDFPKLHSVVAEESGKTFKANAFIKAKAYGDVAQILTLAEDAGLVVSALNGRPGVHSARFGVSVDSRNQKLLKMLAGKKDRFAKFVSVLCLYDPVTEKAQYFTGEVKGKIANEIRGNLGFGYDPLFIPDGFDETFGELGNEVKNKISHRKQAMEKFKILVLS